MAKKCFACAANHATGVIHKMGSKLEFPKGFIWGTSTAGHQVEGHNAASDWWAFEHEGKINDGTVSGRSTDYWNRFQEDHALMKELGLQSFRLGIEWAKIEPQEGKFDRGALERYKDILESLKSNGISICLTMYHWVLPLWFATGGGWTRKDAVDKFMRYCEFVVPEIAGYPLLWVTLNEPLVPSLGGYLAGYFPPEKKSLRLYAKVTGTLLEAHARSARLIHEAAPPAPGATRAAVSSATAYQWIEPFGSGGFAGFLEQTATRFFRFGSFEGWDKSVATGRAKWPFGNNEEVADLFGSYDYAGVNYYTRQSLKFDASKLDRAFMDIEAAPEGIETTEMGWQIYPPGFHKILMQVWNTFRKPIYITENGIADAADSKRPTYLLEHLAQTHRAIADGADIRGYYQWSFIDNFEWREGFEKKFGLVACDHTDPALTRRPRKSAHMFSEIIRENAITEEIVDKYAPRAMDGVFGDKWKG